MNKKYIKKLSVDKPHRDNFPVENLLNEGHDGKFSFFTSTPNNGYVADTFIRPPVNILIEFNEPIKLQTIVLEAKVNAQISNGFIISTRTKSGIDQGQSELKQICKYINHNHKTCYSYKFTRRKGYDNNVPTTSEPMNVAFFNANPHTFLNKVTALHISIIWTLNSSQPCLKSIQVLGFMNNPMNNVIDLTSDDRGICSAMKSSMSSIIKLPDEFIDDLTHEVMRMPIRLPSNKTVDKTTLDRYLKELELNQKPDQDPFTCKPFDAKYKPIIDEQLKSRIDKFFLDNQGYVFEKRQPPQTEQTSGSSSNGTKRQAETLQKILSKKSKSNIERSSSEATAKLICKCCLNIKTDVKKIYVLTSCGHNYCRDCLSTMNKECLVCKKKFNNSNVVNTDRLELLNKF